MYLFFKWIIFYNKDYKIYIIFQASDVSYLELSMEVNESIVSTSQGICFKCPHSFDPKKCIICQKPGTQKILCMED